MAAIYSNGGNRWNILGFNFTKRDALSSVYKISMVKTQVDIFCFSLRKVIGRQFFAVLTCTWPHVGIADLPS
jgi:hypothetical protein